MARDLGEILRRFRPVAAPGPAAPAGVPVDAASRAADELAAVFDALAGTVRQVTDIGDRAAAGAARRATEATETAARIVAGARSGVAEARARAALDQTKVIDDERAAMLADARRDADAIHERAASRRGALVRRLVDEVGAIGAIGAVGGSPAGAPQVAP